MSATAAGQLSREDEAADAVAQVRTLHELVARARRRLPDEVWDYVSGGTETETTMLRNRHALDSLGLQARVLQDVANVDLSGSVLGHAIRIPVVLAPIGSLTLADDEGAASVARAATAFGTVNFVSSVTRPGLEEVAQAGSGPMIFQLYVRGDRAWIDDYVARVEQAGYVALCVTVDSAYYSRRERDQIRGYVPPGRRQSGGYEYQAALNWDTIHWIISRTRLPVILKGITDPADAELAVEAGVKLIYVSNHGGRQIDHAPGSIEQLPDIVDALNGRAEVIVDGGILRGTDVVKALALGARAVAIGKLQVWCLAAGGVAGLVRGLELLEIETQLTMALLGARSVSELGRQHVRRVAPVAPPGITSAFPFLAQEFPGIR